MKHKGRMAEAFLSKTEVIMPNGKIYYQGTSGGVNFNFFPPSKVNPKYTGYPTMPIGD